jgi:hypothetical protein
MLPRERNKNHEKDEIENRYNINDTYSICDRIVEIIAEKWMNQQNQKKRRINWQCKNQDARIKLSRLYPTI